MSKVLKSITVNSDIFNKILTSFPSLVETVDNIKDYYCGYHDKNTIKFNGDNILICKDSYINLIRPLDNITGWMQYIVRRNEGNDADIEADINGLYAWHYVNNLLLKFYTQQQVLDIIKSYNTEYNKHLKQYHFINFPNGFMHYGNCYKYDINGAHRDALCTIFPKATTAILNICKKEKNAKKFFNYYVGFLKHQGYDGVYNWIVQRTTNKLLDKINEVGGMLLYANTDGFMVINPDKPLEGSNILGEFKLEYHGPVYSYVDSNYWCFQAGDKITGIVLDSVRKDIDLSKGQVVHYKRVKNEFNQFVATDIKKECLWQKEK